MAYLYPPAAPTLSGDVETISRFLQSPAQVQRRLRSLAEQRYIADRILTGRFNIEGGAILYETGETIFSDEAPLAIQPGAEYPLVGLSSGTASIAKSVKWGQDTLITDESVKRRGMNPVNRAFSKLVNQNVKHVDSIALSAVASAVTQSTAAAADWTTAATAAQMLKDVMMAKANVLALNQGYDPDVVVVDDLNYAAAAAAFVAAGYFPREDVANNPALVGAARFMEVGGMLWLPTPNVPTANVAMVLDSQQLGGMADENLGGPGYVRSGTDAPGVESKTIRDDDNDQWKVRVRRVTVPVVLEPAAAWKITGI